MYDDSLGDVTVVRKRLNGGDYEFKNSCRDKKFCREAYYVPEVPLIFVFSEGFTARARFIDALS